MRLVLAVAATAVCLMTAGTDASACGRDGDTFTHADGRCIRLFGIDAPELAQPFGPEARDWLHALLRRADWRCKQWYWSHEREVATCWDGRRSLGELLVQGGYAWDYVAYSGGRYAFAEAHARRNRLGLWALPSPEAPWLYRARNATRQ